MNDSGNTPLVSIHDSVAYDVHRCARLLRIHLIGIMRELGYDLSPEMWFVLNKLDWQDGQTQSELCDSIFSERPSLTRMLKNMETKGLIRRHPDPNDARINRVYLSRAGRAAAQGIAQRAQHVRLEIFENIKKNDIEITRKVIAQIEENILKPAST